MFTIPQTQSGVNRLLDHLCVLGDLKNDAALSRELGVAPSAISKLRHGGLRVGAALVLHIHDEFCMSIVEIKEMVSPLAVVAQ